MAGSALLWRNGAYMFGNADGSNNPPEFINQPISQQQNEQKQENNPLSPSKRKGKPPYKVDVLCGDSGLDAIAKYFGNFKFRGKGHEARDLKKLIAKYREWAFIMYPEMRFEDIVEKTKKFSSSNVVKGHLQKLRDKRDGVNVVMEFDEEQKNEDLAMVNNERANNQNNNDNEMNLKQKEENEVNNNSNVRSEVAANTNLNNNNNPNTNRNFWGDSMEDMMEEFGMMNDRDIDMSMFE